MPNKEREESIPSMQPTRTPRGTEIAPVGWLISTPISANSTLWFIGVFGAVLLGAGIFLVHRQIERRIDQIGKL
jgi:hypothetical protein